MSSVLRKFASRELSVGSPIFDLCGEALGKLFVGERNPSLSELERLYVSDRIGIDYRYRIPLLEIQLRRRGIELESGSQGYAELDLIDFISADNRPTKLLRVLGGVGSGKSWFLRYVLHHVCHITPGLQKIFPIILDMEDYDGRSPFDSILRAMMAYWSKLEREEGAWSPLMEYMTEVYNLMHQSRSSEQAASQAFWKIGDSLRRLRDQDRVQPVVVFDNIDTLDYDLRLAVREIVFTFTNSVELPCILPLRPVTLRSARKLGLGLFSQVSYRLDLSPPKLDALLKRRMEFYREGIDSQLDYLDSGELNISLKSGDKLVKIDKASSKNFLDNYIRECGGMQSGWLWKLANHNIRHAGVLMDYGVRRDDTYLRLLMGSAEEHINVAEVDAESRFLRRILLNEHLLYRDENSNHPIPNIINIDFFSEFRPHIVFWLLAFLRQSPRYVRIETLEFITEILGLDSEEHQNMITLLAKNAIIGDVERDLESRDLISVDISPKGISMISNVLENPEYLYHIIVDMPLSLHKSKDFGETSPDPYAYHSRVRWILSLVRVVTKCERELIADLATKSPTNKLVTTLLRRVGQNGLLSEVLLRVLDKVLDFKVSTEAAGRARVEVRSLVEKAMRGEVVKLRKMLDTTLGGTRKAEKRFSSIQARLPQNDLIEKLNVRWPKELQLTDRILLSGQLSPSRSRVRPFLSATCDMVGRGIRLENSMSGFQLQSSGAFEADFSIDVEDRDASIESFIIRIFEQSFCITEVKYPEE